MIDIVALAARSPLGIGDAAWSVGAVGAPAPTCIRPDEVLQAAGMRKPHCARAATSSEPRAPASGHKDPATELLLATYEDLAPHVPRGVKLGLAIGTSSGGMATAEKWFATRDPALADAATYHAPFRALLQRLGPVARATHPVTACSASTLSMLIAMRWLSLGEVDYAIAGGYDALTVFVAAGFEALGATTASPPPRPFRKGRDGMALGEACGLFLLARPSSERAPIARILGAGASGDAVHLTAPDRTGGGLSRAAQRALSGIDPATIDLVSVHGTSTPFNDPMESKAIATALGRPPSEVALHAGKASIGHTLGAAGAMETALAIDCLRRQILPATAGEGELDEEVGCTPRSVNESGEVRAVLKLSAAFGGANAALVLGTHGPAPTPAAASVSERFTMTVEEPDDLDRVAAASGVPRDRLPRMDGVCRLALLAVGTLAEQLGRDALKGAGIVLGTVLATIDVNAVYDENLRKKGAQFAEGRRFAYTTPNAAAGECAMAFGLTGPNLAVSRGPDAYAEANEVARDLIRGGDAERIVVVEVDAGGPAARAIAEATGWPVRFGATARLLERTE